MNNINNIQEALEQVQTLVILGHVRPDGDCVGTSLGLYNYLSENYPQIQVTLCLEPFSETFRILTNVQRITHDFQAVAQMPPFDLCIACDVSSIDRLGPGLEIFEKARKTLCVDHHITNPGFAQMMYLRGGLSSAGEAILEILDNDRISLAAAECFYLAIVHDTGVFKFSATTRQTMEAAGRMMEKGINCTKIIDSTYYQRSLRQTKICGQVMMNVKTRMDGKIVYGYVTLEDMDRLGLTTVDLDGVVDELRVIEDCEVAIFMYQLKPEVYKISLRSNQKVDVSRIATFFHGGGHIYAAGCEIGGNPEDIVTAIVQRIEGQLG